MFYNLIIREGTIKIQCSYDTAFGLCLEAIKKLNCKVQKENLQEGIIEAKGGITFTSLGENISVKLEKINDNITGVAIKSATAVSTVMFDYGKNQKNVDTIISFLKPYEEKSFYPPPPQQMQTTPAGIPYGQTPVIIKEREVLIRCSYCGALNEQGLTKCKECGGTL